MSDITIPPWQPAPPDWTPADRDVLVFRLDLSGEPTAADESLLSDEERSRAGQFRFARHRNRWITCRAALRRLLSHALNSPPASVPIAYSDHGKPRLLDRDLHFNVSHSHDLALIALTRAAEIGIDVETINDSPDFPAIVNRFFTPLEQAYVTSAPPETLPLRFYQCWTRKEAWLKSLGHGLLHPPENVDVSPTLASAISTLSSNYPTPAPSYLMIELRPTDASIAAIVTDASVKTIRLFFLS